MVSLDGRMDYTLSTKCRSGRISKWVCSCQSTDGSHCQR